MSSSTLTDCQTDFFREEGYLIVPDLWDPSELEPLREEMERFVSQTVEQLSREGKLTNRHAGEDFDHRLARIYADSPDNGRAIIRALEGIAGGGYTGREMFELIRHPKLLAAIESVVGPEIVASSVYRIRPKVPGQALGVVPWHQDSGYFEAHCDQHMIITCWVPLVDANTHNGCMKILPRAHRRGVFEHRTGGNANFLVIRDDDLPADAPTPIVAECPRGGVVLMTNLTPHCSTPNHSDIVRWSVDLRYQSAGAPNNVGLWPAIEEEASGEVLMACYPPEADFLIHSRENSQQICDYDMFVQRRNHYDALKKKHYPIRNWKPVTAG
jgi:ectoine hydroxylase-related dioxygenase (phytanoyl-CoA dioxygenase family)